MVGVRVPDGPASPPTDASRHARGRLATTASLGLAAALVLVVPVVHNLVDAMWVHGHRRDVRYDGTRYVVAPAVEARSEDPSGLATLVGVLTTWAGRPMANTDLAAGEPGPAEPIADADVGALLRAHGFDGRWRHASSPSDESLVMPYLARLDEAYVLVRRAYAGLLLVEHPHAGLVLYAEASWQARWDGRAYVLDDPPSPPWRTP